MPALLAFFRVLCSSAVLVPLVQRILVALGVSAVAYAGFHALFNVVVSHVQSEIGALPTEVLGVLISANVLKALSVVLSALVARMTLKGVTELGVLKRITWSGAAPS